MKVLVTGGTGFVGSHTACALMRHGHDVRLLVRDGTKAKAVFALHGVDRPETVTGDVTDRRSVERALDDVDAVVHAAALTSLDDRRAADVMLVNVEGTRNVVGSAIAHHVARVLYVSSASVFGYGHDTITVDTPLTTPSGAYTRSKRDAEEYVRLACAGGARVLTTYPSGVHGPITAEPTDGHRAIALWLTTRTPTSTGTSIVDVRDVAEAHARMLEHGEPARAMLGGHFIAWDDFGRLLEELTDRSIPRVPVPGPVLRAAGRAGDVLKRFVRFGFPLTHEAMSIASRASVYDSTGTLHVLGMELRPLASTLADEIAWMTAHGHLPAKLAGRLAVDARH